MSPGCEDMKHFQPSKSEDRIILLNLEVSDRKCKKMKMEKSTKKSSCSTSRNIWEWSPEWSAEASGSSLSYLLCFSVGDTIRSQDICSQKVCLLQLIRIIRMDCLLQKFFSCVPLCRRNFHLTSQKFCFSQVIRICLMAFFIRGSPERRFLLTNDSNNPPDAKRGGSGITFILTNDQNHPNWPPSCPDIV